GNLGNRRVPRAVRRLKFLSALLGRIEVTHLGGSRGGWPSVKGGPRYGRGSKTPDDNSSCLVGQPHRLSVLGALVEGMRHDREHGVTRAGHVENVSRVVLDRIDPVVAEVDHS